MSPRGRDDESGLLFPPAEGRPEGGASGLSGARRRGHVPATSHRRERGEPPPDAPLAERVRPRALDEVLGQEEVLGEGKPLRRAIEADTLPSLILWGPPGSGKTTLAHVVQRRTRHHFEALSAVLSGVKELRGLLKEAEERRRRDGRRT